MPDIIQLLPDSIANQIAAGEVVQRPASAVKELMENSLDAGATHITLLVKEAGKALIQVIDNGSGMSETDARMSLERHATSKIRKADDLFALTTMGFRGEALASIAAVSQLELRTRQRTADLGTLLVVEGSEVKRQEPTACDVGTSISIRNLFYNIPARRNFLKSNPVELKHILEEFQRIALAYPDIAFTCVNGDEVLYDLAPGKLSQRIVALFGKSYQEQLAPCQEETDYVKVSGYVGKPASAKKTRGEQFLFVNKRFIRSNYLNHAVMTAFEGLLPEGNFPFYVIFMDIAPRHIDVNVHPTKTEIKFDDERAVYAVVRAAVRQALGAHNLSPALDFQADVNLINKLQTTDTRESRDVYFEERFQSSLNRTNRDNWEKLFEGEATSRLFREEPKPETFSFVTSPELPEEKILGQLHDRYILRQVSKGLMIVDQQAAHERVLFERYVQVLRMKSGESQQSLFPQAITLAAADLALLMEMEHELTALGFRLELFGKNAVVVQGIPAGIAAGNEKALVEGLLEQFKSNQSELSLPVQENLARALAKRTSIKSGQRLELMEMKAVVDSLFSCKTPNYSPEGSPTFFIFETGKMENHFTRL